MNAMEDYLVIILVFLLKKSFEMRAGQQRKSERKFFPGYVLVQMDIMKIHGFSKKVFHAYWALLAQHLIDLQPINDQRS